MTLVTRQAMTDDSGTFTDGTVVNEAFVDQVYDQIDDQAHSTTNPTIKPKATTDEVVTARGSKASLDARLDVSLNEDGTLIAPASLVTQSQLLSILGGVNLLGNDTFLIWPAGDSAAPALWVLSGAGAAIVRTGSGATEASAPADTNRKVDKFAAKLSFGSATAILTQTLLSTGAFGSADILKGQKIGFGAWVKASVAAQTRLVFQDGATSTATSYHTGDGTWQFLSGVHTISNSATKLEFLCQVESSGSSYFSGTVACLSDLAPTRWIPARVRYMTFTHFLAGNQTASAPKAGLFWFHPRPWMVKEIMLRAQTQAPTGSALIVDCNAFYGGTFNSMFVTYPQIAAGATTGGAAPDGTYRNRCFAGHSTAADVGSPTAAVIMDGDIDQVGSTLPGTDLFVQVRALTYDRPLEQFLGLAE